jgi:hypothetical protein
MRGSPSPWRVLRRMASEAAEREARLRVSVRERLVGEEAEEEEDEAEGAMLAEGEGGREWLKNGGLGWSHRLGE